MAKNKIQDLFKKSSAYDSKHINNLSTKKVPQELLEAVENGCSYETLQQLAGKKFPICKYQTQITVHGIFNDLKTRRVGGRYVNLTQNKNKSLGIRWTAIDYEKKDKLFDDIRLADKRWGVCEDSQSFYLRRMRRVNGKGEYLDYLAKFKQKAESIDTSLFTGFAQAYGAATPWGSLYVVLEIHVQCFPLENHARIVENVTCMDAQAIKAAREAEMARRKAEKERREREWQAEQEKAKAMEEEARKEREKWQNEHPIPESFKLTENHTFQPGDIECYSVGSGWAGYHYRYRIYSKSFGRLIMTECDEHGNKLGKKGCEAWRKTAAKTYIKVA